ncbi:MAG: hypothetical protein M3245_02830 [Actinomycetota bacterium]|nr:hypothetical protein [Actinomycetota bacterium]
MRGRPVLLATLLLVSCLPDRVELSYGLEPGARRVYRLALDADISRTLGSDFRRERVQAVFLARQEIVERLPGGGALANMSLAPSSLTVDGREVRVGPEQEFVVRLGPDGSVVAIERGAGDQAEPLEPVAIDRLLPQLRPVLPEEAVALGDRWSSRTEFRDETGRFTVTLESHLARLGVYDGRPSALVRTHYLSPVDRRETFANAVADIRGEDRGAQEAWFALDGFLVRATGDSSGTYRILFRPPGDRPVTGPVEGSLRVDLHTEMALED